NKSELAQVTGTLLLSLSILNIFIAFYIIFTQSINGVADVSMFARVSGYILFPNIYFLIKESKESDRNKTRISELENKLDQMMGKGGAYILRKENKRDMVRDLMKATSRGNNDLITFVNEHLFPLKSSLSPVEINANIRALETMDDSQRKMMMAVADSVKESYEPKKLLTP